MPSRTRTRTTRYSPRGALRQYTNGALSATSLANDAIQSQDHCKDTHGNYPAQNPFDSTRMSRTGSVANLNWVVSPTFRQAWEDYPTSFTSGIFSAALPGFTPPTVARVLAQSGPLTPKVNLPLFIFELKDVPRMLKQAGDLLHKIAKPKPPGRRTPQDIAAGTLAYQFGWKPLAEDILKLISFQQMVEKVQNRLDRAGSERGYRHRVNLGEEVATATQPLTIFSQGGFTANANIKITTTRKSWVTVRWRLREEQRILRHSSSKHLAMMVALGIQPGMIPISIWKAIPWTWLIDWFADISNFLLSSYNQLYYKPGGAMLMQTTTDVATHGSFTWSAHPRTGTITAGTFRRVRKTREGFPLTPQLPTIRRPALDAFQLSVLGSLTILRISGRK